MAIRGLLAFGGHLTAGVAVWLFLAVPAVAQDTRLLAFGDSLVHGYGLPAADSFPAQLERALNEAGAAVQVINSGNSGDTTAAGLARLDWALADHPDAAIVVLGGNDGLRGLDPRTTFANLDALLGRFAQEEIPVLLTGMLAPRNLGQDYAADFDSVFPRLAEKHGVAFYPFFLEGVAAEPALNQADGIHPNARGVALIVEQIVPYVLKVLPDSKNGQAAQDG